MQSIYKKYPFQVISEGNDIKFEITKQSKKTCITPQEVSSEILKYFVNRLKSDYDFEHLKAVITVPAYFNNNQRSATMEAAKLAGIDVIRLLSEPTAASIYYLYSLGEFQKTVMVFDFGGGTFDVSIVKTAKNDICVKCIDGHECLGGRNLDDLIFDHFIKEIEAKGVELTDNERRRLKPSCEQLKKKLSKQTIAQVNVESFTDDYDITLKLSREQFDLITASLMEKCIDIVDRCLSQNKLRKKDIDEIVLIGGSTKIPKIQQMLSQYFDGMEIKKILDPATAVAAGASIEAYNLHYMKLRNLNKKLPTIDTGHQLKSYINVSDVTSFSIGMEVMFNGMFWAINRNTPIPTEGTFKFLTSANNQKTAELDIYEGRWNYSLANNLLGKITIDDLPRKPRGEVAITIFVSVDENNILSVTGEVESTGVKKNIKISLSNNNFAPKINEWDDLKDLLFEKIRLIKCIAQFACDDYVTKYQNNSVSRCIVFLNKLKNVSNTDINELKRCISDFLGEMKSINNNKLIIAFTPILNLINSDIDSVHSYFNSLKH